MCLNPADIHRLCVADLSVWCHVFCERPDWGGPGEQAGNTTWRVTAEICCEQLLLRGNRCRREETIVKFFKWQNSARPSCLFPRMKLLQPTNHRVLFQSEISTNITMGFWAASDLKKHWHILNTKKKKLYLETLEAGLLGAGLFYCGVCRAREPQAGSAHWAEPSHVSATGRAVGA